MPQYTLTSREGKVPLATLTLPASHAAYGVGPSSLLSQITSHADMHVKQLVAPVHLNTRAPYRSLCLGQAPV